MALIGVFALMIIGILVMFRVIPVNNIGSWIIGIILFVIFVPVLFPTLKSQFFDFVSVNYPWWVYILYFFVVLVILRMFFDFLFLRGRRR